MGRKRDEGTEEYATVTESAHALGVKPQAIYNRIHADPPTIPFEKDLDETTGRASYRIPRGWLDREVEKRKPLRVEHGENLERQLLKGRAEVLARFEKGVEAIRKEVETQHTQLLPLQREQLENQTKMLGEIAGMKNALDEFFKLARRLDARLDERERVERKFQTDNLKLGHDLKELSQRTVDLFEEMKAEANAIKAERERRGEEERRSPWSRMRRFFSGD